MQDVLYNSLNPYPNHRYFNHKGEAQHHWSQAIVTGHGAKTINKMVFVHILLGINEHQKHEVMECTGLYYARIILGREMCVQCALIRSVDSRHQCTAAL